MARHDGDLKAAAEVKFDIAELISAMRLRSVSPDQRHDAIARYLAAGDDWRDAGRLLSGAFAPDVAGKDKRNG